MGMDKYMGYSRAELCFVTRRSKLLCSYDGQVTRNGFGTEGRTACAHLPMSAGEVHHDKVHLQKSSYPLAKLFLGVGKKVDTRNGENVPNTLIRG